MAQTNNWLSNLLPAIENIGKDVGQTAQNLGQSFQVPVQQLGHGILPKIIPQVTSQQQQQAMQGSEFAMAPYSLADPANGALGSSIDTGVTAATPAVKAAIQTGKEQPGGLQAGFVKVPEPENGGKYINENTATPRGGTPAKVKAAPPQAIKFKYVPPQVETEAPAAAPQVNAQAGELPPITSEPSAQLSTPAKPTQPGLKWNQKVAQQLNGLSNYQLPASYGENRPNLEAQDKSVMQNVIKGNTANKVLQNANKAKADIWDKVESAAGQHQAVSTNAQVLPYIKAPLDDLVNKGIITQAHADKALVGEMNNLTQNGGDITGNANITGNQLVDLRTGANAVNKGVPYGSTNPIPYIRQAIAKGYSDAVGHLDPAINNLYQQYSSVKRIGDMSQEFRNQKLGGTIPLTHTGVPLASQAVGYGRRYLAQAFNGNPKALLPPIVAGGAALAANQMPNILNDLGYVKKGNQQEATGGEQNPSGNENNDNGNNPANHNSTMITQVGGNVNDKGYGMPITQTPQSVGDVKLNADGTVNAAAPSQITAGGKNIAEDPNTITSQITTLQGSNAAEQAAAASLDPTIAKPAQAKIAANNNKIDALNNLKTSVAPVYASYNKLKTLTGATNTALQTLSGSNINITDLNSQIDSVQNSLSPAYADLKQQLSSIQGQIQGGNLNVKTQGSLNAVLKKINQQNVYDYYTAVGTYASPTDATSTDSQTNLSNNFTPSNNLPAITSNPNFNSIVGGTLPQIGSNNGGLPTTQ